MPAVTPFGSLTVRVTLLALMTAAPFGFVDLDGDGTLRIACLGDSNTSPPPTGQRWCETGVSTRNN